MVQKNKIERLHMIERKGGNFLIQRPKKNIKLTNISHASDSFVDLCNVPQLKTIFKHY